MCFHIVVSEKNYFLMKIIFNRQVIINHIPNKIIYCLIPDVKNGIFLAKIYADHIVLTLIMHSRTLYSHSNIIYTDTDLDYYE